MKQLHLADAILAILAYPGDRDLMLELVRVASKTTKAGEGLSWSQVVDAVNLAFKAHEKGHSCKVSRLTNG